MKPKPEDVLAAVDAALDQRKPFVSPTWRLAMWALNEVGLPTQADLKKLSTLDAEYLAACAGMAGLSHNDAVAAFKATKHAVQRGEAKPSEILDWPTVQLRYQARRSAVRAAMLKPATEAALIVAEILEQGAAKMPALAAKIDASERALVGGAGPDGKSNLVRSIEALEDYFKLRAKMLRQHPTNSRPADLLKAD